MTSFNHKRAWWSNRVEFFALLFHMNHYVPCLSYHSNTELFCLLAVCRSGHHNGWIWSQDGKCGINSRIPTLKILMVFVTLIFSQAFQSIKLKLGIISFLFRCTNGRFGDWNILQTFEASLQRNRVLYPRKWPKRCNERAGISYQVSCFCLDFKSL